MSLQIIVKVTKSASAIHVQGQIITLVTDYKQQYLPTKKPSCAVVCGRGFPRVEQLRDLEVNEYTYSVLKEYFPSGILLPIVVETTLNHGTFYLTSIWNHIEIMSDKRKKHHLATKNL